MPHTVTIVLEDDDMDSGCIHAIISECLNHAKILSAVSSCLHSETKEPIDLMHFIEHAEPSGIC